ncbi:carboxypeptidase-like regulatory domain-containing protein [Dysgonomonas sp.]
MLSKRVAIILFALVSCMGLPAQIYIKGTVVDKDTKKAIPDVIVQYGSSSQAFTYTDAKGQFRIPENSENIIHFQYFGYKTKSIPRTGILQNSKIELEISPLSLEPVVISPDDADKLLDEAMLNTKKKLVLDQPVSYLLHFIQNRSTDTLQNEIYMRYASTLNEKDLKKNLKKEKVPYVLNLIEIMRLQKTETPTSDLYGAEYHASHLFTFGKSANNETFKSYSSDSSLIYLRIEPLKGRDGWARGEIVLNRADATIVSMEIESIDSVLSSQPHRRYMGKQVKTLKKLGRFSFKKYGDRYYMSDCFTYYKFRSTDEHDRQEDVSYYCDVDFRGFVEKDQLRKRRLGGYCQELFYFPDSTDKPFWLDEFDEELAMQYQGSGMAGNSKPKKGSVWKKIAKSTAFAAAVAAIALLVK